MSLLTITAFGVIAANAMFYQSGVHPQPLWDTKKPIAGSYSSGQSVPVNRVKTTSFPAVKIPVPVMRPKSGETSSSSEYFDPRAMPVDTAYVQRLMLDLGFYKEPVDGLNGPQTELAIRSFEKSKYLPESGDISPSLVLLLESAVERAAANIQNASSEGGAGQNRLNGNAPDQKTLASVIQSSSLPSGSVGPAMIKRIQVGLINYGSREVRIDGVMGNQTKIAIEQFQERFNIEINGIPSEALINKLESIGALTRG